MILVTVGTDLPFDRLVRVVDEWAREQNRRDVFAQIGKTDWKPSFIPHVAFMQPPEFNRRFTDASIIIGHAGMGTILSALRYEKPILVMPRRAHLGEQRNDHQLATAQRLLELEKINVAFDEAELRQRLARIEDLKARGRTGRFATPPLINALRSFIHLGEARQSAPAAETHFPAPGSSAEKTPILNL